jgi:hypothetical protein
MHAHESARIPPSQSLTRPPVHTIPPSSGGHIVPSTTPLAGQLGSGPGASSGVGYTSSGGGYVSSTGGPHDDGASHCQPYEVQ